MMWCGKIAKQKRLMSSFIAYNTLLTWPHEHHKILEGVGEQLNVGIDFQKLSELNSRWTCSIYTTSNLSIGMHIYIYICIPILRLLVVYMEHVQREFNSLNFWKSMPTFNCSPTPSKILWCSCGQVNNVLYAINEDMSLFCLAILPHHIIMAVHRVIK
jgi:hypothetical protein